MLGPFFQVGQRFLGGFRGRRGAAEKAVLAAGFFALAALRLFHGPVNHREHLRSPRSEGIHRARFDQAFENALVQEARVDVIAELVDRGEAPEFRARIENSLDRVFADILDGAESEANGFANRSEIEIARIDIGRKDRDAHAARFVDVLHDFFGVARFRGEQRGHELDGIMRFQIRGLVGQQRVGAGVRFVEAVPGEFRHQVENLFGFFRGNFSRGASGQEFFALRRHFFAILFAHRAAQNVRFAQRKAGQAIGDLHDLFLIQNHAVGLFQNFLQLGQIVSDFLFAVLAVDEVVDHAALDRAGAVQRVEGGEIFEARGLVAAQNVTHAVRFKLKNRRRFSAGKKFVGRLVIQRQRAQIDVRRCDSARSCARCRPAR